MGRSKGRRKPSKAKSAPADRDSYWAIVTFVNSPDTRGFYLDSIVKGLEAAADVEVEAVKREGRHDGYNVTFVAPVTAGFMALRTPKKSKKKELEINVWLLTRDANGFREYEVKLSRDEAEPEHEDHWKCICLEKNWTRRISHIKLTGLS